jgi:hypothetical protein
VQSYFDSRTMLKSTIKSLLVLKGLFIRLLATLRSKIEIKRVNDRGYKGQFC